MADLERAVNEIFTGIYLRADIESLLKIQIAGQFDLLSVNIRSAVAHSLFRNRDKILHGHYPINTDGSHLQPSPMVKSVAIPIARPCRQPRNARITST